VALHLPLGLRSAAPAGDRPSRDIARLRHLRRGRRPVAGEGGAPASRPRPEGRRPPPPALAHRPVEECGALTGGGGSGGLRLRGAAGGRDLRHLPEAAG
jgi:hypothetical protein